MKRSDDILAECNPYFKRYLELVPDGTDLLNAYDANLNWIVQYFKNIPLEKHNYQYAPEKWTVKEVFQHLIDTERIFMYRCFRLGRQDKTNLAPFDQDQYIEPAMVAIKSMKQLIEEFESVRAAFTNMLRSFRDADLKFLGTVDSHSTSARAVAFINLAHYQWHLRILQERYFK